MATSAARYPIQPATAKHSGWCLLRCLWLSGLVNKRSRWCQVKLFVLKKDRVVQKPSVVSVCMDVSKPSVYASYCEKWVTRTETCCPETHLCKLRSEWDRSACKAQNMSYQVKINQSCLWLLECFCKRPFKSYTGSVVSYRCATLHTFPFYIPSDKDLKSAQFGHRWWNASTAPWYLCHIMAWMRNVSLKQHNTQRSFTFQQKCWLKFSVQNKQKKVKLFRILTFYM